MYYQCTLQHNDGMTSSQIVSWIPQKYATIGKKLKVKTEDGSWTEGWIVTAVGNTRENPPNWHKDVRGHKKSTGDEK